MLTTKTQFIRSIKLNMDTVTLKSENIVNIDLTESLFNHFVIVYEAANDLVIF